MPVIQLTPGERPEWASKLQEALKGCDVVSMAVTAVYKRSAGPPRVMTWVSSTARSGDGSEETAVFTGILALHDDPSPFALLGGMEVAKQELMQQMIEGVG